MSAGLRQLVPSQDWSFLAEREKRRSAKAEANAHQAAAAAGAVGVVGDGGVGGIPGDPGGGSLGGDENPLGKDKYARENHCEIERRRRNKMSSYINVIPTKCWKDFLSNSIWYIYVNVILQRFAIRFD